MEISKIVRREIEDMMEGSKIMPLIIDDQDFYMDEYIKVMAMLGELYNERKKMKETLAKRKK